MALRATKGDEDGPPLWGRLSACGPDFIRSTGRRPAHASSTERFAFG
jgi:hypothetical protein